MSTAIQKDLLRKRSSRQFFYIILYGHMSVRPVAQKLAQMNVYNKGKMGHRYTELSWKVLNWVLHGFKLIMCEIISALQSIWKSVILFNEIPGMLELQGNDEGMYIHFLKCFLKKSVWSD